MSHDELKVAHAEALQTLTASQCRIERLESTLETLRGMSCQCSGSYVCLRCEIAIPALRGTP